jgi:hypothetical protein
MTPEETLTADIARANRPAALDAAMSPEDEAALILDRVNRELAIEEAMTAKLLRRYGLPTP